ncbi:hypothetical protein HRbin17_01515 [bacterium HR17]|jgi:flagellar FliJ protein|uniref:Flagellar FliJ protein n=1 Tax=Candidatus Fervidibacter japonicus TaxID=2035412 RepID=A0A2H5XCU9_9BACT|nr:hypothetical protein HRbin17_01515 [bacterium HR17]
MRRFRFALDGVLQVRRVEEQQAERQLQLAQARLRQAEEALTTIAEEHATAVTTLRQLLAEDADAHQILLAVRRLDVLEQRRALAQQQVAAAEAEVERRLQAYRECRQRRELLEELRQKAWRQWLTDALRAQQVQADERAMRDFAVAQSNGE